MRIRPRRDWGGARIDACVDAWRYLKPDDAGYTYDGVLNACASPGVRRRPLRIFCSADLRRSLRGATLVGTAKCARPRAITMEGFSSDLLHPLDHFGVAVDFFGPNSIPKKTVDEAIDPLSQNKKRYAKG